MTKGSRLRELIQQKELVVVPGVYDALSARIADYCGFETAFMTGYGTAAALGYPDLGLLTMTEMIENLRRISNVVDIPLIADADTGYGNPMNVYRTVQEYEKAGAAAIQIEDQTWPKRCGHMEGKQLIEAEVMVAKIKAAVKARCHPETVLVVRTDAIGTDGFEEAIRRGLMYAAAGADVLFIEAPHNKKQIQEIPKLLPKPCVINLAFGDQVYTFGELEKMGYSIALYPIVILFGAIEGSLKWCKSLLEEEKSPPSKNTSFYVSKLNEFIKLEKFKELEAKFI